LKNTQSAWSWKSSQNFFNGTGAKATDQLRLAPIFPVTNCVRATPSGLDFTKFSSSRKLPDQPLCSRNPHYLIFPVTIPFNSMQTATHGIFLHITSCRKTSFFGAFSAGTRAQFVPFGGYHSARWDSDR
jgi:hypothetical protein